VSRFRVEQFAAITAGCLHAASIQAILEWKDSRIRKPYRTICEFAASILRPLVGCSTLLSPQQFYLVPCLEDVELLIVSLATVPALPSFESSFTG
jgi:hypothetical protein